MLGSKKRTPREQVGYEIFSLDWGTGDLRLNSLCCYKFSEQDKGSFCVVHGKKYHYLLLQIVLCRAAVLVNGGGKEKRKKVRRDQ